MFFVESNGEEPACPVCSARLKYRDQVSGRCEDADYDLLAVCDDGWSGGSYVTSNGHTLYVNGTALPSSDIVGF